MFDDSYLDSFMESYIGNWSEHPYVPECEEAEDRWMDGDVTEANDLPDDYYDEPDNDPYYGWEE